MAGGLDPALAPAALVIPVRVAAEDGGTHDANAGLLAWLGAAAGPDVRHDATLASASRPVTTCEAKAALRERTQAAAVDMESAAIAAVAGRAGVPFAAVRSIVDPADLPLPRALAGALRDDGSVRALALAGALLRRPQELPGLLALARHYRRALARLRATAGALVP